MHESVLEILKAWFSRHSKVLVAFSGGADSCLAAYLGRTFLGKENCIAVISTSPSLKRRDLELARKFAKQYDIKLHEILTDEMENPQYLANPSNRCYFCKNSLYMHLNNLVKEEYDGFEIVNGNNFSDLGDYRPGMDAAKEHRALSPFVECSIDKATIRRLSKQFDLFTWDKPASPCLSSRFPYGHAITAEKLQQVEMAEEYVLSLGISNVRVRHFGNTAKVEVPVEELNKLSPRSMEVIERLRAVGFTKVEIDHEGLVSGKMNRVLGK